MDSETLSKRSRYMFFLCWFVYMINYVCRKNYSVCMTDLIGEGILSDTFAGTLLSGFFAVYGFGQLFNGYLGGLINPQYMIFTGLTGAGLCNMLLPLLRAWPTAMLIVWCLNGLFCSMIWAPVIRCFSDYMTEHDRTRYAVSLASTTPVGQILAYLIASLFLAVSGWRMVFLVCGLTNVTAAIIWICGLRRLKGYIADVTAFNQQQHAQRQTASGNRAPKMRTLTLFLSTGVVFAVLSILCNGILKDGVTDWTPTFLSNTFKLSSSTVSLITIILPIINLAGAYAAHWVYRHVKNEYTTIGIMFFVSAISLMMLTIVGKYHVVLAALLIAVSTSSMLGANNMLLTYIPLNYSGVGKASFLTGLLDASSYLAAAVSGTSIGFLSSHFGWTATMWSWVGIALLGMLLALLGSRPWARSRPWLQEL